MSLELVLFAGTKLSTVPNIITESTAPGEVKVSWGWPPGTNTSEVDVANVHLNNVH